MKVKQTFIVEKKLQLKASMAANYEGAAPAEDIEGFYNGHRVQPLSSTPVHVPRGEEWKVEQKVALGQKLGVEEFFSLKLWRASVAEVVGTAALVFALDTIVISSYATTEAGHGNTHLVMSVIAAITISILLLATAPISGGHLNPAVSLAAALSGLISFSRAVVYIFAQCIGGVIGALAIKSVVNSATEGTFSLGACTLHIIAPGPDGPVKIGLETGRALWLEIICTFFFLFASIWMAFDGRQIKASGRIVVFLVIGLVLGLLVFVSTSVTGAKGYVGAGMNPARCLGPALVRGGHLWDGHWVFWVGPLISCVLFYLYTKMIPSELIHEE